METPYYFLVSSFFGSIGVAGAIAGAVVSFGGSAAFDASVAGAGGGAGGVAAGAGGGEAGGGGGGVSLQAVKAIANAAAMINGFIVRSLYVWVVGTGRRTAIRNRVPRRDAFETNQSSVPQLSCALQQNAAQTPTPTGRAWCR
jgi:hypothetical protein